MRKWVSRLPLCPYVLNLDLQMFYHRYWTLKCFLNIAKYIYIYIYGGSISPLIHIWLNNIDILCLHIFVFIFFNCRIDFMVTGWNWLINFLWLIGSQVLSSWSWAIIRSVYFTKELWPLLVHKYFVNIERLAFYTDVL